MWYLNLYDYHVILQDIYLCTKYENLYERLFPFFFNQYSFGLFCETNVFCTHILPFLRIFLPEHVQGSYLASNKIKNDFGRMVFYK